MHALWMVLAAFFFASMGVCIKAASPYFSPAEMVFYRGVIGMMMMVWLARHQRLSLKTRYPGMHAWRSLIGVASLGAWFYAIAHLPLATAMTLNYMSSVWVAVFLVGAALWTWRPSPANPKPPLQGSLVATIIVGFVGVILMLRPNLNHEQAFAGMLGLMSGMAAAFAYMQVVALSRVGEPETRTVFYFAAGSALAGGAAMLITGISPWADWNTLWLIPIGVLASIAQLCLTKAYAQARTSRETLVVANLQYSGIIFGAISGMVFFGDKIPLIGWFGMFLIITSGIAATVLRSRSAPDAPSEER
ncbi:DMT family transporter [Diaphorobacter aerolatus]|uniref:DMT family transporter n=1 Tax=Diaphorobacter aerolatus TaxID=1288495 RepID=A0A7H0GMY1_9BURK|nr:DMT family transporter [Diaphorobacter aerolatus]QNP49647.1 DMT family transporter [Diaphorobacter aerolatus]